MANPPKLKKALLIYRGDTLSRTFTVGLQDPETEIITGINLNTFGSSWAAQLRATENADASIPLTVDISQANIGKITIGLDSVISQTVPSKGVWDVQITNTTVTPHVVTTIIRGDFELVKDVTRP